MKVNVRKFLLVAGELLMNFDGEEEMSIVRIVYLDKKKKPYKKLVELEVDFWGKTWRYENARVKIT